VEPEAIDPSFVPSRRPGLAAVAAGSELLIVDGRADLPHLLSPTATLVWSFIDGVGSLAEFATDLVEVLGLEPARAEADVVELARDLGRRGLLAGVEGGDGGDGPAPDDPPTGPVPLTAPANVALDARFDRPGSRVTTLHEGAIRLDVRVDDPDLADELVAELARAGLAAGPPRPVGDPDASGVRRRGPLYSLLLGRPSTAVTGLHLLYRSARPLRRCRTRADLVRITVADVAAVLDREARRRPLLDAVGLTRDGRMVAIDPIFSTTVDDLESRLRGQGIERLDASLVAVASCDAGRELTGLVLRPVSHPGAGPTPAALALGAVDLARDLHRRVSPEALARLCEVVGTTTVRTVPGRAGLRAAISELLG
jgi:hypothetical protein